MVNKSPINLMNVEISESLYLPTLIFQSQCNLCKHGTMLFFPESFCGIAEELAQLTFHGIEKQVSE